MASPYRRARIYADLIGLILAAVSTSLLDSSIEFAGLYGPQPDWLRHAPLAWDLVMAAFRGIWLAYLIAVRVRNAPGDRLLGRALRWVAVVVGLCGVIAAAPVGDHVPLPLLDDTAAAVTTLWLAYEVLLPHRVAASAIGLSWRSQQPSSGRTRTLPTACAAFVACAVTGSASGLLRIVLQRTAPGIPVMHTSQDTALGVKNWLDMITAVANTLVMEDVVLLAAACLLMQAAGRPAWQIYVLVCSLTVWGHAYMGVPAVALAFYAAYRVTLFRRRAFLAPIATAHALWDLLPEYAPSPVVTLVYLGALWQVLYLEGPASVREALAALRRRTPSAASPQSREAAASIPTGPSRAE